MENADVVVPQCPRRSPQVRRSPEITGNQVPQAALRDRLQVYGPTDRLGYGLGWLTSSSGAFGHSRAYSTRWVRTSMDIDSYVDFDHALADPARPNRMNPPLDIGGRPNEASQRALSEAVNLSLFD